MNGRECLKEDCMWYEELDELCCIKRMSWSLTGINNFFRKLIVDRENEYKNKNIPKE